MTTPLVLTFVGDDRPGLVNAISERIAALRRDLAREPVGAARRQIRRRAAGQRPDESTLAALKSSLREPRAGRPARLVERGAAVDAERPGRTVTLDIVGQERPGIVRDVTQALDPPRRQHRGIRERPGKGAVHRRRDVPRQSALERPRGPRARRLAQGARAACRRDHGRSQRRRGRGAPLTGALSAACAPAPGVAIRRPGKMRLEADDDGEVSRTRVLRRSADRQSAPRQLPRRDQALCRDAERRIRASTASSTCMR